MAPALIVDLTSEITTRRPHLPPDTAAHDTRREREWSSASSCTLDIEISDSDEDTSYSPPFLDLTADLSESNVPPIEPFLSQVVCRTGPIQIDDLIKIRRQTIGSLEIDFLLVTSFIVESTGETTIYGMPLIRCPKALGRLVQDFYELCLVHRFERRGTGSWGDYTPLSVRPEDVIQKRNITFTNRSYTTPPNVSRTGDGQLTCRWKLECYYNSTANTTKPTEEAFKRLSSNDDLPHGNWVDSATLKNNWRGSSITERFQSSNIKAGPGNHRRQYTFFDAFAGAGGVSRGAQNAGFKVRYAVDKATDV
ncbi:hypothetical protein VHEMI06976 [[Torrubiella] hemipterigena]|uniref:Uncharacterized protein n=1 Tax=[Torrubiella] hemipterigena TaxID=1531966 RepID=A0A0A1TM38_9HYPO|nr:hypothetical protein VHEMI06976 [[Torrubiella] hemipterigena]